MGATTKIGNGPSIKGYKIVDVIGSGGMATIFKGTQESLRRSVVIKELSHICAQDQTLVARFVRESQVAAALSHENIVHIYDYSHHGDSHCIIMEYVEGIDLANLIERLQKIPLMVALIVTYEISRALHYAHSFGVIHRDIKPANILISRKGGVKLMDFGIAQVPALNTLTIPGTFLGTPSYMSPEQAQGDRALPSSDQFSLGVVLYEMATGMKPFFEDEDKTIFERIRKGDFMPPRKIEPAIPRKLAKLITKALDPNPSKRFSSTLEMTQEFYQLVKSKLRGDPRKFLRDFLVEAQIFEPLEIEEEENDMKTVRSGRKVKTPRHPFNLPVVDNEHATVKQDWSISSVSTQSMALYHMIRNICLVFIPTLAVWSIHNPSFPPSGPRFEINLPSNSTIEPALPGRLKVNALPWAMVYLDNRFIALTPTAETFFVASGGHTLRFANPSHSEKEIHFELRPGEQREIDVKFEIPKVKAK